MLQARIVIVHGPSKMWGAEALWKVMTCCAITHNMIRKDKGVGARNIEFDFIGEIIDHPRQEMVEFEIFLKMH